MLKTASGTLLWQFMLISYDDSRCDNAAYPTTDDGGAVALAVEAAVLEAAVLEAA